MKNHLHLKPLAARLLVAVMMCLPVWGSHTLAQVAESYAVFDATTGTLTFKHDTGKNADDYALNEGVKTPAWISKASAIKKVVFETSFAEARPTTCYQWFSTCSQLTTIEGLSNLNTEKVTNMKWMFNNCKALTNLDVSTFDTKNVTNMEFMFCGMEELTALDVSNFNTEKVTSMYQMFGYCKKLQTLDLKNFNTQQVTDMGNMFDHCEKLTALDVSSFNTENVNNMYGMFQYCYVLATVDISRFNTKNVTNMEYLFYFCQKLTTIDVSKFDTQNVKSLKYMFGQCNNLASIDVSHFNTEKVTNMGSLFYGCRKLTSIDITNFNTQNVTEMNSMFGDCYALKSIDLSHLDTRNVINMNAMFATCSELTSLDVSNFDTRKVTNMMTVFANCRNLTVLDVTNFDTREVKNMAGLFSGCEKLTTLDLSNFNTKKVYNMRDMFGSCKELTTIYATDMFDISAEIYNYAMFTGCEKLVGAVSYDKSKTKKDMANYTTGYFTKGTSTFTPYAAFDATTGTLTFYYGVKKPTGTYALNDAKTTPAWITDHQADIKKVVFDASFADARPTSCYQWFMGCSNLTSIDNFKNLKTDNVTTMASMFKDCKGFTNLDAKTLNTQNVTDMTDMFAGCSNLTVLDVSTFDTQHVESMNNMFAGCEKLTDIELSSFDTKKVKNMSNMFNGCKGFTILDISKFNTATVENMSGMFRNCSTLTTIYAGKDFVVTAVTADADMFTGCTNLIGASVFDDTKTGKDMANRTTGYFSDPAPSAPVVCVVFNAAKGTLTFVYDTEKHPGAYPLNTDNKLPGWRKHVADITEVVFDASFATARPTSFFHWFTGCSNLKTIKGIEHLNTEEVTNMQGMFWGCENLTAIDLSRFNTSKVTDMSMMFYNCRNLTTINVSKFDTQNVTAMNSMFYFCNKLTAIDLSTFNTAKVTNMSNMFAYASEILSINVSNFDTKQVKNMNTMFGNCGKLTTLDLSSFDTHQVEDMSSMFINDISIATIFVSDKFVTTAVTNGSKMFTACHKLRGAVAYNSKNEDHDMANYTTGYFTNISPTSPEAYAVFNETDKTLTFKYDMAKPAGAYPLNTGDESPSWGSDIGYKVKKVIFDASFANVKPTTTAKWFQYFGSLEAIEGLENFNTEEVTNMNGMFNRCGNFTTLNLSTFNTAKVTDMSEMFKESYSMTNIYVSDKFVVTAVTADTDMFKDCPKLRGAVMYDATKTGKDMANYTTGYFTNATPTEAESYVVYDSAAETLTFKHDKAKPAGVYPLNMGTDVPGWVKEEKYHYIKKVIFEPTFVDARPTSGYRWFDKFTSLKTIEGIEYLNTEEMTNMNRMFYNATSLTTLDLVKFNTAKVTDMSSMFEGCRQLTVIHATNKFVVTAVTADENMFKDCIALIGAVYYDATQTGKEMANSETGYFIDPTKSVAYVIFDEATGTLNFKYDTSKPIDAYMLNKGDETPSWSSIMKNKVQKVIIDPTFVDARPASGYQWFHKYYELKSIEGLAYLNTEQMTNMSEMFYECSSLTTIDVSKFNTANVTDMSKMFYNCSAVNTLDISNFNTEKVTDMRMMFYNCEKPTTLDVSKFNTANVTNMSEMFYNCKKLTTLNVSKFNTSKVTDMSGMFNTNMLLTTLDVSKFDTQNVTNMEQMFFLCKDLTILDVTSFNTAKVTNMKEMFSYCRNLVTIYASDKFVTTAVTNDLNMFEECLKLHGTATFDPTKTGKEMASLTGYFWDRAKAMTYVVFDETAKTLTFKHDTSKPVDAYWLNEGKKDPAWSSLLTSNISKVVFDASFAAVRPTTIYNWFAGFENLSTIEGIENLNTEEVTNMSGVFNCCTALSTLDLKGFNTAKVTDMSFMFNECSALTNIDLSSFDTKNVIDMNSMFYGCKTIVKLDVTKFDTEKVTNMNEMFSNCYELTTILASGKFVTTNVADAMNMFYGSSKLKGGKSYDAAHVGKEMANFAGYFTDPTGTGINNVDALDGGKVEYYDLRGRRLDGPQKGVNIMKIGNKTKKIVVR